MIGDYRLLATFFYEREICYRAGQRPRTAHSQQRQDRRGCTTVSELINKASSRSEDRRRGGRASDLQVRSTQASEHTERSGKVHADRSQQ